MHARTAYYSCDSAIPQGYPLTILLSTVMVGQFFEFQITWESWWKFKQIYLCFNYVSDLISQNQIDVEKFPSDHSVLSGSFCLHISHNTTPNRNKSANGLRINTPVTTQCLPKVQVPDDFLCNPASIEALSLHFQNGIVNIDRVYRSFCNIILKELPIKRKQTNTNVELEKSGGTKNYLFYDQK